MNSPYAWAAGWALLHSLWQGALVAIILWAVVTATRSARVRYGAACVAMLAILTCFGVTLLRLIPDDNDGVSMFIATEQSRWSIPEAAQALATPDMTSWVPWLAIIWLSGLSIGSLKHMAGWFAAGRLRRRGVCSPDEIWSRRLGLLAKRLRVSPPVQLLESCLVDAPMVLGHFRPVILIPIGLLAGLPTEQVEAILLHELAHVRRYDYLVNVLQGFVEAVLFYHPAVWWIAHVIRVERENCCDDVAVAVSGDAHSYASALAELEVNRQSNREPALAANGGSLVKRIHRLLYPKKPAGSAAPLLAVILMVTAAAGLMAWQSPKPGGQQDSPFMKWVKEDVVYIISNQERTTFLALTTDSERNKFVDEFWLRRDPTPGTPRNEYKEEHYRRIEYSMKRFTSDTPGWKTDRGRTYILYGPPDELESHPAKTGNPYPHELWMYRWIDGIGNNVILDFMDSGGGRGYRLTTDPHAKP